MYVLHVNVPLNSAARDEVVNSIGTPTTEEDVVFPGSLAEFSGTLLCYKRPTVEECEALLFAIRAPAASAAIHPDDEE